MNTASENRNQSQRILNSAFTCILTNGYANVSMRNIADEAGVVLSQLNYYYKNKEGLFSEVVKMLAKKYLEEIEDILKKGESANDKIHYLINYFDEMLKNDPGLFKLLFDLTSMALWSKALKELLSGLFNDLTGLIDKYIVSRLSDKEKLKNYSSEILSRTVLGSLIGTSIQIILANGGEDTGDSLSATQLLFR